jgi:crooked neck
MQAQYNPANCATWSKYAELEAALGDVERSRAIFDLAVDQVCLQRVASHQGSCNATQPVLDMPEVVWKAYIDFEVEIGERNRARELFERLLKKTQHVKVRIYAPWELLLLLTSCARTVGLADVCQV